MFLVAATRTLNGGWLTMFLDEFCCVSDRRDRSEGAGTGDEPDGDLHHGVRRNGAHRAAANARQQQYLQQGGKNAKCERTWLSLRTFERAVMYRSIPHCWCEISCGNCGCFFFFFPPMCYVWQD